MKLKQGSENLRGLPGLLTKTVHNPPTTPAERASSADPEASPAERTLVSLIHMLPVLFQKRPCRSAPVLAPGSVDIPSTRVMDQANLVLVHIT